MAYALNTLSPARGSRRAKKRVGRGNASGHGTYSTRGMKGQRARSGGRKGLKKKGMKRIIASLPKLGGFRSLRVKPATITLRMLSDAFPKGGPVTIAALKRAGLVHARAKRARVVGGMAASKAFALTGVAVTPGARTAIEKAGGTVAA